MKFLLTTLAIILVVFNVSAKSHEDIKLGTNITTKKVEVRFNSKSKKNTEATFTVTSADGIVISTHTSVLAYGANSVCMCDTMELAEGTYTVTMVSKNKTSTTQFIIWK